jgi:hypothetical protein
VRADEKGGIKPRFGIALFLPQVTVVFYLFIAPKLVSKTTTGGWKQRDRSGSRMSDRADFLKKIGISLI